MSEFGFGRRIGARRLKSVQTLLAESKLERVRLMASSIMAVGIAAVTVAFIKAPAPAYVAFPPVITVPLGGFVLATLKTWRHWRRLRIIDKEL